MENIELTQERVKSDFKRIVDMIAGGQFEHQNDFSNKLNNYLKERIEYGK